MESNSAEAWEAHGATPLLFRPPPEETPPVKPIALPTADDVGHTPPGLANPLLEGDTNFLSTSQLVKMLALLRLYLNLFPPQHQWSS